MDLEEQDKILEIIRRRVQTVIKYLDSCSINDSSILEFLNGNNIPEYLNLKINFRPSITFYRKSRTIYNKKMNEFAFRLYPQNKEMIIDYLTNINITPNDIILLENNKEYIRVIESKVNEYILSLNKNKKEIHKSYFDFFESDRTLVLLASKLLKDKMTVILYKKYDENLENTSIRNIAPKEDVYIYNVVIPKMKNIIKFLESNNITVKRAEYLLSREGKNELTLLKELYNNTKNYENRKYTNFFKRFKYPEYLVKLSINFLPGYYKETLFKKYGTDLKDNTIKNIDSKLENKIEYIRKVMNKILEFLKIKEITEKDYEYLISTEGKEELDKLKNEYKEYKDNIKITKEFVIGNSKCYKYFYSYFPYPKEMINLAVLFLDGIHKEILYKKYDTNLENTKIKEDVSKVENSIICNTIIPKLLLILDFISKENIPLYSFAYLNSLEGKEDLQILIDMFKTKLSAKKYVTKRLNNHIEEKYSKEIKDLEKLKILILLKKYEGKINIQTISEILELDKNLVFDTYITYKLTKK